MSYAARTLQKHLMAHAFLEDLTWSERDSIAFPLSETVLCKLDESNFLHI